MNPWEHTKFFYRMESDVGFRKFYRGIYDGLRLVWCNSLEEKTECLKKSGAETRMRRKRMVVFNKLSSDCEYEERIRWKDENSALSTLKKRSRVKRKNSSRPSKLKRMRMRSLKVS